MCCQGAPIGLQNMQSPQVQGMMNVLAPLITQGLGRGATPYPGQLSAPPDPSMMAAMNTMMGMGGYGGYGGSGGGGGMGGGFPSRPLPPPRQPGVDPYTPGQYGGGGTYNPPYDPSKWVTIPGKDKDVGPPWYTHDPYGPYDPNDPEKYIPPNWDQWGDPRKEAFQRQINRPGATPPPWLDRLMSWR